MLHPHPEARFQTREQMQAHIKGVFRRMGEPAKRLAARQRELDALEAARIATARREQEQAAALAKARSASRAAHGPNDVRRLVHETAQAHGVTFTDIMGKSRKQAVVRARWAAIAAVRQSRPMWSLPRIGAFFDLDHTSVLHALRRMSEGAA